MITERAIAVIASTLKNLYEDKCTGKIPEAVFIDLMSDFTKEQAAIEEQIPQLRRRFESVKETSGEIDDWLSLISSYMELETLDRATVTSLIEKIIVPERVKVNGKQTQELEIEYRFIKNLLTNAKEEVA